MLFFNARNRSELRPDLKGITTRRRQTRSSNRSTAAQKPRSRDLCGCLKGARAGGNSANTALLPPERDCVDFVVGSAVHCEAARSLLARPSTYTHTHRAAVQKRGTTRPMDMCISAGVVAAHRVDFTFVAAILGRYASVQTTHACFAGAAPGSAPSLGASAAGIPARGGVGPPQYQRRHHAGAELARIAARSGDKYYTVLSYSPGGCNMPMRLDGGRGNESPGKDGSGEDGQE